MKCNIYFFVILIILIFLFISFYHKKKEKFNSECVNYGDDYNACYSEPNCTIGFLPDGSTHCMKKFLYEKIFI